MEDGLRVNKETSFVSYLNGLNPCFNGRWSARLGVITCLSVGKKS